MENSLDAGADSVDVTVFEGGTEYIRVADNGTGMSENNARLALKRHATSKIRAASDLSNLHTLGFRGEALPSIASVSEFELLTRTPGEDLATSLKLRGGATRNACGRAALWERRLSSRTCFSMCRHGASFEDRVHGRALYQ